MLEQFGKAHLAAAAAAGVILLQDDTFFALVEYKYKSKVLNDPRVK
jgi:hypothetical protein